MQSQNSKFHVTNFHADWCLLKRNHMRVMGLHYTKMGIKAKYHHQHCVSVLYSRVPNDSKDECTKTCLLKPKEKGVGGNKIYVKAKTRSTRIMSRPYLVQRIFTGNIMESVFQRNFGRLVVHIIGDTAPV